MLQIWLRRRQLDLTFDFIDALFQCIYFIVDLLSGCSVDENECGELSTLYNTTLEWCPTLTWTRFPMSSDFPET